MDKVFVLGYRLVFYELYVRVVFSKRPKGAYLYQYTRMMRLLRNCAAGRVASQISCVLPVYGIIYAYGDRSLFENHQPPV